MVRWSVATDDFKNNFTVPVTTNAFAMGTSATGQDQSFTMVEKERQGRLIGKTEKPPDPLLVYATNIVQKFDAGAIVLFHVGYTNTVKIL